MRHNISRLIKVFLAFSLVFMVAAPLIVGVYDATFGKNDETADRGITRAVFSEVSIGAAQGNGLSVSTNDSGAGGQSIESDMGEDSLSVSDWFDCDPAVSDLVRSGSAHLIFNFADGTSVDFGNPYLLDWSDVAQPDDYDELVNRIDEVSIFETPKAYASPVTWVMKKLNYLAVKSGYWKSFQNALWSLIVAGGTAIGIEAPVIMETLAKFEAEAPAICEIMSKEGCVIAEEDAAMLVSDAFVTATSRGYTVEEAIAKLPNLIEEEAASINATGQLLGGGSANFMNVVYEFLSTNQVTTDFVMSNADFFVSLFSWLGADLTAYDDVPSMGDNISSVSRFDYGNAGLNIRFADTRLTNSSGKSVTYLYDNGDEYPKYGLGGTVKSGITLENGVWSINSGTRYELKSYNNVWQTTTKIPVTYTWTGDNCPWIFYENGAFDIYVVENGNTKLISQYYFGVWRSGNEYISESSVGSGFYEGDLLGQDAQYDEAGNIIDYGNLTVPNIYDPAYQAPLTWHDALDQMHTAPIENGSKITDTVIGSPDTGIGDWINDHQTPVDKPSEESNRDDFKVQDLETVFPFCIPWDIYYMLAMLSADPIAPNFIWSFDFAWLGTFNMDVDLSEWEYVAQIVRTGETIAFCIGLALVTRDLIRG